jgi:hypothetical protein
VVKVLCTAWQITKGTAPVWLPGFAIIFGVLGLVGGTTCER